MCYIYATARGAYGRRTDLHITLRQIAMRYTRQWHFSFTLLICYNGSITVTTTQWTKWITINARVNETGDHSLLRNLFVTPQNTPRVKKSIKVQLLLPATAHGSSFVYAKSMCYNSKIIVAVMKTSLPSATTTATSQAVQPVATFNSHQPSSHNSTSKSHAAQHQRHTNQRRYQSSQRRSDIIQNFSTQTSLYWKWPGLKP